jgi:hypothetical protein
VAHRVPLTAATRIRTRALPRARVQSNVKYFKIYRWDPEVEGQKPYLATYAIDMNE